MKKEFKGHANKGGVYKIVNLNNSKIYIGSAKTFKKRAYQHASSLKKQRHQNKHLQASWDKHGADAFLFEVVEVVDGDKVARTTREQELINEQLENWEGCYNFKKKTVEKERSCWSKSPEKTRKKISDSVKKKWKDPDYRKFQSEFQSKKTKELWQDPEYRAKHVEAIREFAQKSEYRKKLSKSAQGRELSKETRKKISKSVSKANKKLWQDPEYRKEVIKGRKKAWAKDNARKKRAAERFRKISQKTYKLCNPQGKIMVITNMQKFCEQSDIKLVPSQMSKVARGKKLFYKGWTLPGNQHLLPRSAVYKFRNPQGEMVEVTNLSKFAKRLGVNRSNITNVVYKSVSHCRGWTLADQTGVPRCRLKPQMIISPSGEEYLIKSIKEFCESYPQFCLNKSRMSLLLNKHINSYKGWTTP